MRAEVKRFGAKAGRREKYIPAAAHRRTQVPQARKYSAIFRLTCRPVDDPFSWPVARRGTASGAKPPFDTTRIGLAGEGCVRERLRGARLSGQRAHKRKGRNLLGLRPNCLSEGQKRRRRFPLYAPGTALSVNYVTACGAFLINSDECHIDHNVPGRRSRYPSSRHRPRKRFALVPVMAVMVAASRLLRSSSPTGSASPIAKG